MSVMSERDQAMSVAKRDPSKALALATKINDPWYRCQALAAVAKYTEDKRGREAILKDAFEVATQCKEPNRIVTVSAWPLRVLCDQQNVVLVKREVERLLSVIAKESHPTRRGDGKLALIWALHRGPKDVLMTVVERFKETCQQGHGWKRDRNLYEVALLIKKHDRSKAKELLELIEDAGKKRNAPQKLEAEDDEQFGKAIDLRFSYRK